MREREIVTTDQQSTQQKDIRLGEQRRMESLPAGRRPDGEAKRQRREDGVREKETLSDSVSLALCVLPFTSTLQFEFFL